MQQTKSIMHHPRMAALLVSCDPRTSWYEPLVADRILLRSSCSFLASHPQTLPPTSKVCTRRAQAWSARGALVACRRCCCLLSWLHLERCIMQCNGICLLTLQRVIVKHGLETQVARQAHQGCWLRLCPGLRGCFHQFRSCISLTNGARFSRLEECTAIRLR